jgi:ubiquinone/menaquinone biosynthesis C-methylase UbiE
MSDNKKTVLFDIDNILRKITVEEGQKVAELGCGNFGFFVWPLAKLVGRRGQVYAVDVLRSTLEEIKSRALKENFPQVKTIWSDLEIFKATNIETSSLDCALLINVLHQSDKRLEILRETIRLLKRGGKLLIVEWEDIDSPLGPKLEKRVKLEALKSIAPKMGLDIREEFIAGPYHYGIVLTKL